MVKIPDQVAGYRIRRGEALGLGTFGRTFLATRDGSWGLVKVLRRGEQLALEPEAYAKLCADPRVLGFSVEEGEEVEGHPVLSTVRPTAAPLGVVAGGSPLQEAADQAARELDAYKRCSLALLRSGIEERVLLLRDLAHALAGLEASGWRLPYLNPWNVLVVREDDGARLIPCEPGLGYEEGESELLADRLHEDAMVYIAPELLAGLLGRKGTTEPTQAAGVYAFGATAWTLLHDQPVIPLGTAGRELSPAELLAAPSRRVRALGNGGVSVVSDRLSSHLSGLLARMLSVDPGRRPAFADVVIELDAVLAARRLVRVPPTGWQAYAVAAALVIACVAWLAGRTPPATGRRRAIQAFAAATHEADLDQREAALTRAQVTIGGQPVALPEAKRLQAIDGWLRWQARAREGKPPPVLEVVRALEREAIRGYEDRLGHTLRFLVGFLRRWELGGAARSAGDEHLTAIAEDPSVAAELRTLAEAARSLSPTEGTPESASQVSAWLSAATRCAAPAGPLVVGQAVADYGDLRLTPPVKPIGLDAGWMAELIAGRVLVAQGKTAEGVKRLEGVHESMPCYVTQLSLGFGYVRLGGPATAKGDRMLEQARALRNDPGLHLTRARVALGLGRFGAARAALDDALAVEPAQPAAAARVRWQVQGLRRDVAFREAISLADRGVPAAEIKLRGALAAARSAGEQEWQRLIPDLTIALGVFLAGQGREAEARRILWKLYDDGKLDPRWTNLPALEPQPPTRRPTRVRRLLFAGLVQDARALSEQPRVTVEEFAAISKRYKRLRVQDQLLEPEEPTFRAWYRLARAQGLRRRKVKPETVLEALVEPTGVMTARLKDAENEPQLAREAEEWLLRVALFEAEGLPPAARVRRLSAALEVPGTGRVKKQRAAVFQALQQTVQGFLASRRKAWEAITPERPRFDAAQAKADEQVLEAAIAALRERQPGAPLTVATCQLSLALLRWSRGADPAGFAAARQALQTLAPLEGEPEADELGKRVHFAQGLAALRSTGEAATGLKPSRLAFACERLARSLGEEGYAGLLGSLRSDKAYHPFGPANREQAPLFWLARARAEVAEAAKGAAAQAAWGEAAALYEAFGRLLGNKPAPPGTKDWAAALEAARAKAGGGSE